MWPFGTPSVVHPLHALCILLEEENDVYMMAELSEKAFQF